MAKNAVMHNALGNKTLRRYGLRTLPICRAKPDYSSAVCGKPHVRGVGGLPGAIPAARLIINLRHRNAGIISAGFLLLALGHQTTLMPL